MLRYSPASQLTFADFDVPSLQKLDPRNRWVVLAEIMPWDQLALVFAASPTAPRLDGPGRPTHDLRLVMGALLVQHLEALSDERTLELIRENVYVQFFCGLPGFQAEPPFEASSLTHWRAWLGDAGAQALSETLADILEERRRRSSGTMDGDAPGGDAPGGDAPGGDAPDGDAPDGDAPGKTKSPTAGEPGGELAEAPAPNRGTLLLDATCAPADVRYPTDVSLLAEARRALEGVLDALWRRCTLIGCGPTDKPRTYRRTARKSFAAFSRRRRPSRKVVRRERRRQLQWAERDLGHCGALLDDLVAADAHQGALTARQHRRLLVCAEVLRQQRLMHESGARRCDDRIVSVTQPHVRPIVRGKAGARAEFGPKVDVSLSEGIARVECASFDAYHEGCIAIAACERYHQRHGRFPEKVLVDAAYLSRENRRYFKARGIRYAAKPQGRPPKDADKLAAYRAACAEADTPGERNPIEGWFGVAKRRYRLGRLRTRRAAVTLGEVYLIAMAVNLASELTRLAVALRCLIGTVRKWLGTEEAVLDVPPSRTYTRLQVCQLNTTLCKV